MFDKSKFNHSSFNRSQEGGQTLYATLQSSYGMALAGLHVLVQIQPVRFDGVSAVEVGTLWLKLPIPAVQMDAEYALQPNLTALITGGAVAMEAEFGFNAYMHSRMPLGELTIEAEHDLVPTLWVYVPLPTVTARAEHSIQTNLSALVPISTVRMDAAFDVSADLYAKMPLPAVRHNAQFGLSAKVIRSQESEELTLEGINLRPGSILVIDTDTLDVEVDGVPRVDAWVLGSTFFQLKKGENILTFSDNAQRRNLATTVVWADRYL